MADTQQEYDYRGKLAAITGASSGIGYELAKVFAEHGFDLVVGGQHERIWTVVEELKAHGGKVVGVQSDLATPEGTDAFWAKVREAGGPLDTLVLNAGVGVGGSFVETNLEEELNVINLNIVSLVTLTKYALPDFVARGSGRILFTSSIAAELPGPYLSIYAASKAFVQSFAEAIRFETKETGVTITALQPGPTETNFFARADMLDTKVAEKKKDDPAKVARDGFEALMAGQDHVVAGSLMNKVQSGIAKIVSEKQAAAMHATDTKPKDLN